MIKLLENPKEKIIKEKIVKLLTCYLNDFPDSDIMPTFKDKKTKEELQKINFETAVLLFNSFYSKQAIKNCDQITKNLYLEYINHIDKLIAEENLRKQSIALVKSL